MAKALLFSGILYGACGVRMGRQGAQLPVKPNSGGASDWWVQDGELSYFQPAFKGLSRNISDYYYARGSSGALTEEHMQHRVGGSGQVHIFHLPQGTAVLKEVEAHTPKRGAALSELRVLTVGAKLSSWPTWTLSSNYLDPLKSNGLATERRIMKKMKVGKYRSYLEHLTQPGKDPYVSTRNSKKYSEVAKVVEYIKSEFESAGLTTCVHNFDHDSWYSNMKVTNVIGVVKGSSSGSVTIGAHYDDLPSSNKAPGAEDNGSGTAAVLTAARAFMAANARPKKTMYFVAFGGEEQGLYGSAKFAKELQSGFSTIPSACRATSGTDHTGFTMDMVGYRRPEFSRDTVLVETKSWSKSLVDHLAKSNEVNNRDDPLTVTYSDNPFGSDHMSFLNNNLKATLLIDNDGDTDKYPCYHKSCDNIDQVNMGYATRIAKMNLGGALRVAGLQ